MKKILFTLFLMPTMLFSQKYGFERFYDISVDVAGNPLRNAWAGGFNSTHFSEIDLNLDGVKDLFQFDWIC